ncbi:hypothetical protein [Metabacillus hrfriensis]|uniref:Uncharacterized protein n=1 Tax=Metabacillus hrfriensis TaxID=3048891 RepID=A0ACD4RHX4_9BACI|nr:hypothetical protein [Metabacillus sp. CT-WN-B3]WHZ60082.1 hypothetical protein QLQ22_12435 [Metabacillus sp. CT-WN-B3]
MFILEGLHEGYYRSESIEPTIDSILRFLEFHLNKEPGKHEDFVSRKFKEVNQFVVIGFDSLEPVSLSVHGTYEKEKMSESQMKSHDLFDPLFHGSSITNNQYRKLYIQQKKKTQNNMNAFSDYVISHKALDKTLPNLITLSNEHIPEEETVKRQILHHMYQIFNDYAGRLSESGAKTQGLVFFIDFNTVLDLDVSESEKIRFIHALIEETGLTIPLDYSLLEEERWLNAFVYVIDSIRFQSQEIFEINEPHHSLEDLLSKTVLLNFEMPTNEKKILGKRYTSFVEENHGLPKVSFLELVLLRYLVVSINKQGKMEDSGFLFPLNEIKDQSSSVKRVIQVVADPYGNVGIHKLELIDLERDAEFISNIKRFGLHYFDERIPEEQALERFWAKFFSSMEPVMKEDPKLKERIFQLKGEKKHMTLARTIYDLCFRRIENKVRNSDSYTYYTFVDFVFVLSVLSNGRLVSEEEGMGFMKQHINVYSLLQQEVLTSEELHFVMGHLAARTIKDSRNKSSLQKSFLKKNRTVEILDQISKRMETGMGEISNPTDMKRQFQVIVEHMDSIEESALLTAKQKFSYVAGLISGDMPKKTTKGDESNDSENE